MNLTGAQALVRVLAAERVSFAFGVVGGKLAPLLHAIRGEQSIRYIGVRHEAAGPMMAAAVFAGSGCMAVALGEMGPGGLNLASGVGTALNNNLAVLLITTNQHRAAAYPHGGMFMDLDTVAVLRPLTKWNAVVHDPRRMPELVRRAFREALSGRPGPVHLDVPHDVLSAQCTFADDEFDLPPARYRATARPRADAGADRGSGRPVASGAAPDHRRGRRRGDERRRAASARARKASAGPGGADPDGARRGVDRKSVLHRTGRNHRRRCRAGSLRAIRHDPG